LAQKIYEGGWEAKTQQELISRIQSQMARNIYYPTMFGHISIEITKHLQKLRNILKEYFLKPRIGF
jgi:hypothetical protein